MQQPAEQQPADQQPVDQQPADQQLSTRELFFVDWSLCLTCACPVVRYKGVLACERVLRAFLLVSVWVLSCVDYCTLLSDMSLSHNKGSGGGQTYRSLY